MNGQLNQQQVGVFVLQPLVGGLPSVRRAIVHNLEDPFGPAIRFPAHHLLGQAVERNDAGGRVATAEDLGVPDMRDGFVSQVLAVQH